MGPLWAPMGTCGPGPCGPPWALVGRALMGPGGEGGKCTDGGNLPDWNARMPPLKVILDPPPSALIREGGCDQKSML